MLRATTLVALLALLALPVPGANAGRLIETGEVPDVSCVHNPSLGACHFLRVALDYVRSGAPDPTKPILLFDEPPDTMLHAIVAAYGGSPPFSIDEHKPSTIDFNSFAITPRQFSAIVVASDFTCGGFSSTFPSNPNPCGDLNPNSDGHAGDLYYDFINAPRGLLFNGDPSALTPLGLGIGFSPGDIGHSGCPTAPGPFPDYLVCPYDAFFPLPTGSSLRVAETDNLGDPVTLFQDTDPPVTTITSAPAPLVVTRGPASASFTFSASENLVSFECRLDGGTFTPCSSPASYQNLGEGTHVFSVRAIDAAGNVEAAPPAAVWLVAFDQDGDGYTRFSNPPDCNDNNPNVHPGAPEAAGGTRDSDCDGVIDPFPRIQPHAAFLVRPGARFTEFVRFVVSAVPAGATVEISCFKRRHCPFRRATVKIRHANGRASFTRLLRGRHLPVGLGIAIRITRPGTIGGFELLRLQRLNLPRVEVRCMNPGSRTPLLVCQSFR